MKVNEFVKKFGWENVKSIVLDFNYNSSNKFIVNLTDNSAISIYDLKRLVESYELVEFYNGLDKAKKKLSTEQGEPYYNYSQQLVDSLKQAIADVESCM